MGGGNCRTKYKKGGKGKKRKREGIKRQTPRWFDLTWGKKKDGKRQSGRVGAGTWRKVRKKGDRAIHERGGAGEKKWGGKKKAPNTTALALREQEKTADRRVPKFWKERKSHKTKENSGNEAEFSGGTHGLPRGRGRWSNPKRQTRKRSRCPWVYAKTLGYN